MKTEGLDALLFGDAVGRPVNYRQGAFHGSPELKDQFIEYVKGLEFSSGKELIDVSRSLKFFTPERIGKPVLPNGSLSETNLGLPVWALCAVVNEHQDPDDTREAYVRLLESIPARANFNHEQFADLYNNTRIYDWALVTEDEPLKSAANHTLMRDVSEFFENGADPMRRAELLNASLKATSLTQSNVHQLSAEFCHRVLDAKEDTEFDHSSEVARKLKEAIMDQHPEADLRSLHSDTDNMIAAINYLVDGQVDDNGVFTPDR